MESKKGLVLGGGGSRGSYEVGVCQALHDLGYQFDMVTGVSIGALIGAMVVQQDVEIVEGWMKGFTQDKLSHNLFVYPNQYKTKPLHSNGFNEFIALFSENGPDISHLQSQYMAMFDFERFKNSPIDFGCLAFNLNKNRLEAFVKDDMNKDNVKEMLFASTAYFPAYQFVKIGEDYYADGGYEQTLPVKLCMDMGANSLIVVDISAPNEPVPTIAADHVLIRPLLQLHSVLDFEGRDLVGQMREGYLETLKYLDLAPGYLYTFYDEDWKLIMRIEKACLSYLVHEGQIGLLLQMNDMMKLVYDFFLHYQPLELHNTFSSQYIVGRLFEVLGLICAIPMDRQYHFKDFIRLILMHLDHFNTDPNTLAYPEKYDAMVVKGVQDMIVFFHSALVSFKGKLPDEFNGIKEKFYPMYVIANAWRMISHFRGILDL